MKIMTFVSKLVVVLALAFTLTQVISLGMAYADTTSGKEVPVCYGPDCNEANAFVDKYLNPVVKVLTAFVGIASVLSIIFAGIQYSSSADDPGMVTKAKQRVFNVVLGLVMYVFLLALLNYLIPGGIW